MITKKYSLLIACDNCGLHQEFTGTTYIGCLSDAQQQNWWIGSTGQQSQPDLHFCQECYQKLASSDQYNTLPYDL